MKGRDSAIRRIVGDGAMRPVRWIVSAGVGLLLSGAPVLGVYMPFACAWTAAVPLPQMSGA